MVLKYEKLEELEKEWPIGKVYRRMPITYSIINPDEKEIEEYEKKYGICHISGNMLYYTKYIEYKISGHLYDGKYWYPTYTDTNDNYVLLTSEMIEAKRSS